MSRNDSPTHNTFEGMLGDLNKRMAQIERYAHHHGNAPHGLKFPGLGRGEYASTPDHASLDLSEFCIIAHIAPDDWTPASWQWIASKWGLNQHAFALVLMEDGSLRTYRSVDGTTEVSATSDPLTGVTNGQPKWVAAGFDNDEGGNRVYRWWISDNGIDWTLHDTNSAAGAVTVFNSSAPFMVGSGFGDRLVPTSNPGRFKGEMFSVSLRNGPTPTSGVEVARFDGSVASRGSTQTDSHGRVWTVTEPRAYGVVQVGALPVASVSVAASANANVTIGGCIVTLRVGRRYRIVFTARAMDINSIGTVTLRNGVAGADLAWGDVWWGSFQNYVGQQAQWTLNGDGFTYDLYVRYNAVTASVIYSESNGFSTGFYVEDVGPAW
jgi:hypothetical protein